MPMNDINQYLEQIQYNIGNVSYIKLIKTGKEAQVHLIKVQNRLCALKIYKSNTKFSSRNEYFNIEEIGDKRLIRGAKKKTNKGLKAISSLWKNREYNILEQLYEYQALVPQPILNMNSAILMEYLGDINNPAPRLIDITIPKQKQKETYNIIIDHINLFKQLGFAHGDLSAYNILWYNELPYIIDFPQIIYQENREYRNKMERDIKNINEYFGY